jgi:hypothetical protein
VTYDNCCGSPDRPTAKAIVYDRCCEQIAAVVFLPNINFPASTKYFLTGD